MNDLNILRHREETARQKLFSFAVDEKEMLEYLRAREKFQNAFLKQVKEKED